VSAFVALRTILRLRDRLLAQFQGGCQLRLTVGVDLGGTSRDVLEELLRWNCEVFIFHNPIPRATFHPKIYLFENATETTLIVGSNNLTDGGLYTNYEAAVRHDFELQQMPQNSGGLPTRSYHLLNPAASPSKDSPQN
jgi:HKD family nuclease